MFDDSSNTTDRRGFVGAVATLGAGLALPSDARVRRLFAAQQPSDAWLDHLKGKHRQLFDVPEPEGGTALRHLRNYLDAWRNAFGVEERDVSVVVTLYARTTPLGLQDAMWEKYQLGAAADVHADLVAHALPGVVIVPDVLVTMTKAHERGFAYVRS